MPEQGKHGWMVAWNWRLKQLKRVDWVKIFDWPSVPPPLHPELWRAWSLEDSEPYTTREIEIIWFFHIFLTCHMSMLEDFDATCKHSQDSSIEKQSGAIWHSLKGKKRRLSHELDQHRHRWPDHRIHSKSPKMMHHLAPWIDWHLQHPKIKDNQFKTLLGGVAPWLPGPACSPNSSSSEKWAARAARMATWLMEIGT